ncbi:hypothetical protein GVN24_24820 [Rhizobium sp. CRIBSB]|nr:hypothetical protein [Rhizobium sp. CRIBSB]
MHRIDTTDAVAARFNDNPAVQSPTTRVTAAFLNDVQENLCTLIEGAGLDLVKGAGSQVVAAIEVLLDQIKPIGEVSMLDGPNVSPRLCEIDTEYLKADYPRLVAYYTAQGRLIAGSTGAHFRTPDYAGLFARAASSDDLVDPDGPRAPGSLQDDAFRSHTHTINEGSDSPTGAGLTSGDDDTSIVMTTQTSSATGGDETRPKNVALRWVIRGR